MKETIRFGSDKIIYAWNINDPVLNHILLLFDCIIDLYFFYSFFQCYFHCRNSFQSVKNIMKINAVMVMLTYLVNAYRTDLSGFIVTGILSVVYVCILFDGRFADKLLYFTSAFCIISGGEVLCEKLFHLQSVFAQNSPNALILFILGKTVTYFVFIIAEYLTGRRADVKRNVGVLTLYLAISVSCIGVMVGFFCSDASLLESHAIHMIITASFLLMLVENITMHHVFHKYSEQTERNTGQQALIERQKADLLFYQDTEHVRKHYGEIIHNTKNYLVTISNLARTQDYEAIIKLINEIGEEMNQGRTCFFCHHRIMNAILNEKKHAAGQKQIQFDVEIDPKIKVDHISDADLVAMLGNLLDNAIRAAASHTGERYVLFRAYTKETGGYCLIKITNAFSGQIIKENDTFLSTKKTPGIHGVGLKSVSRMAEKYGGYLVCNVKDNVFEASLLLPVDRKYGG